MSAPSTAWVHTADNAVPPLDSDAELADLIDGLEGRDAGLDLIVAGARLIALERKNREQTQTMLARLGGSSDNVDVLALVGALIRHLADADFNPALRELHLDEQANLRRTGAAVARDLETTAPRDLVSDKLLPVIDPYVQFDDGSEEDEEGDAVEAPTYQVARERVVARHNGLEADITDKSWLHKTAPEMTDEEVDDARATYGALGSNAYEGEWLRRHGLPEEWLLG